MTACWQGRGRAGRTPGNGKPYAGSAWQHEPSVLQDTHDEWQDACTVGQCLHMMYEEAEHTAAAGR